MHQTNPQIRTEYKIPTHSSRKTRQIHIVHFLQFYYRRQHAAGKQLVHPIEKKVLRREASPVVAGVDPLGATRTDLHVSRHRHMGRFLAK